MLNRVDLNKENKGRKRISQVQMIAFGFVLMILIGTLLLMLPVAARDGKSTDFLSALFTATSASCVTGLVVFDTYKHWSIFGQMVIIILIQIGGLGFISIGVGFSILFRRRIGLGYRNLIQESISALQLSGIVRLTKRILIGTIIIEGAGAILLAIKFIPQMGILNGIYYSCFHSISAFCNAGFDLMGKYEEYSSFSAYYGDLSINVILCFLILVGGLGFMVWDDLYVNRLSFSRYRLHTKLVLVGTAIFTLAGLILFWILERNTVLAGMTVKEQFCASLFGAVTPRTAGFNTTDTGQLSEAGSILTMFLMLVGGNSGSTAGGAKVTTFLVLYLFVIASFHQSSQVQVFGKRLTDDIIRKAAVVFTLNLSLAIFGALFICAFQPLDMRDVLFETFSAVNTVGMTRNLTRELNSASKLVIILLMYFGRVGSLTFAFSFFRKRNTDIIKNPVERISVG